MDLNKLLVISHKYNTKLTTFLTAVLAKSIFDLQSENFDNKLSRRPIRIMIPVDLRRRFNSNTVRHFTLYVMPKINYSDFFLTFEELINGIDLQIKEQNKNEVYSAVMDDYKAKNNSKIIKHIPLPLKCLLLRCVYDIFGDSSTSITLSNLGKVEFIDGVDKFIESTSFFLTPKKRSNYNCSLISFRDKLYISFSCRYQTPTLAQIFFSNLTTILN